MGEGRGIYSVAMFQTESGRISRPDSFYFCSLLPAFALAVNDTMKEREKAKRLSPVLCIFSIGDLNPEDLIFCLSPLKDRKESVKLGLSKQITYSELAGRE